MDLKPKGALELHLRVLNHCTMNYCEISPLWISQVIRVYLNYARDFYKCGLKTLNDRDFSLLHGIVLSDTKLK